MSDMTHKMWSQWKDFRLNEKKGDHEGQMAKSQLKRSVKLARMDYEVIDGMKKDEDGEVELPAWLQSALTIALENLQSVHTYLDGKSGLDEYSGAGGYVPGSMSGKGAFNPAKMKYSSPEAQKFVQKDIKSMGKIFNKASQQSIKMMMDGVKGNRYDAMDLIRGIMEGKAGDTSLGVREMLRVLWNKVEKRFRSYLGGKKRR